MRVLKRFLTVIVVLLFVTSVTACSTYTRYKDSNSSRLNDYSELNDSISTPPPPSSPTYSVDPYGSISNSIKGSTVRFATWIDHTMSIGAVPLANFEHDTGLKVELYNVAESGYVNSIITKMASGDTPDVFVNKDSSGGFPLTLQIAAPIYQVSTVNLNDPIWDKQLLERCTIDGNVYLVNTLGSPWSKSYLVYYNKVIFEENGFKTPEEYYNEGTWSWGNMLKCLKDIESVLGPEYKGGMIDPLTFVNTAGASFIKYDHYTGAFSSGIKDDMLLKGYEFYASMHEAELLDGSINDFLNNKCGIIISDTDGLWNLGHFYGMNPDDIGYTFLPTTDEGEYLFISSELYAFGICENAPNADAAGYFLRYWLDPNNYDLTNQFITNKAGNFYYQLTNSTADKYFDHSATCLSVNKNDVNEYIKSIGTIPSGSIKSALDGISGHIDSAVNTANNLVKDKIAADREKYK